eukprot:276187-Pelagomonas_calceolata.AAC.1
MIAGRLEFQTLNSRQSQHGLPTKESSLVFFLQGKKYYTLLKEVSRHQLRKRRRTGSKEKQVPHNARPERAGGALEGNFSREEKTIRIALKGALLQEESKLLLA